MESNNFSEVKTQLNSNSFHEFLKSYNEEVQKGHYIKNVPYHHWRILMNSKNIQYLEKSCEISLFTENGLFSFIKNDGGFCDYFCKILPLLVVSSALPVINKTLSVPYKANETVGTISIDNSSTSKILDVSNSGSWVVNSMESSVKDLSYRVDSIEKKINKENDNMKGFKFDFGPCTNDNIRMSAYGLAVKNNADTWVSYNPKSDEIVDVDIFNFDGRKFMFKMPVAIKDISVGDIVIHNRVPMFVTEIVNKTIKAVDVRAGERKEIVPTKSPFGFNFITKVVSMFENMAFNNDTASEDNPFGNPMMMMLMFNDEENKDFNFKDAMLMFMMMQNQGNASLMQNPMMMYFMMKDGDMKSDMLPLMMMMSMNQTPPQPQYPIPCAE